MATIDELPTVASREDVERWLAVARRGDRFVYARATLLPRGAGGAALLRDLARQGAVLLVQERDGAMRRYVATRTGVAVRTPAARMPRRERANDDYVAAQAAVAALARPTVTAVRAAMGVGRSRACAAVRALREDGLMDAFA